MSDQEPQTTPTEDETQRVGGDTTPPIAFPMPTERLAVEAPRRSVTWVIVAAAVAAFAVAAFAGYLQARSEAEDVLIRAAVGPGGGQVVFADQGRLQIPPGALGETTTIEVRRATVDRPVRLDRQDGSTISFGPGELDVFVFEPSDLTFDEPVTVALPSEGGDGAVFVEGPDGVRVIRGDVQGDTVVFTTTDLRWDG